MIYKFKLKQKVKIIDIKGDLWCEGMLDTLKQDGVITELGIHATRPTYRVRINSHASWWYRACDLSPLKLKIG